MKQTLVTSFEGANEHSDFDHCSDGANEHARVNCGVNEHRGGES